MSNITPERLREFTAVLQKYKAGKASLERRVVAAENWWKLRNRFEERKQGHGSPEGYQSESGWLHNVIVSKHADAMEAYPEPIILPREPGDAEEARLLSAILPCVLEQNRFEKTYDAAMWQKLKTGTAAYRVVWDPDKLGGLGDISIERVDLLNLFWEPGIDDIQKSRYLFCTHLEDEDLLQERYPQLRGRMHSGAFRATRFVYDDAVDLTGKATVIEVYYKRRGVLHYCKYVGDTVLYATENEEEARSAQTEGLSFRTSDRVTGVGIRTPEGAEEKRIATASVRTGLAMTDVAAGARRDEQRSSVDTAIVGQRATARVAPTGTGMPPLPKGGCPSAHTGAGGYADGEDAAVPKEPGDDVSPSHGGAALAATAPFRQGGQNAADEQWLSLRAETNNSEFPIPHSELGLYAHGRYPFVLDPLFPVEGSPCGYGFVDLCANAQTAIDLMRTAFVKNTLVGATPRYFQRIDGSVNEEEFLDLTRPLVHVSGNLGEDSLRQIGFAGLPGVYVNVLESTIRELRETTGNTETANGTMNVGVTAASAIAALQEASGKGSRDATRASYAAFAEIVELCIELIREFYTLPRQFRITGGRGMDFISYSNAALRPREQFAGALSLGLSQPVFDVKVAAQKRSAYSRLSQNELAMQLYRLGLFVPGNEQQAMGLLSLMEFDGKEELESRLEAGLGLREKLRELSDYKALALALARRYRPDLAAGLQGNAEFGMRNAEFAGGEAALLPPPGEVVRSTDRGVPPTASLRSAPPPEGEASAAARARAATAPLP